MPWLAFSIFILENPLKEVYYRNV